MTPVGAQGPGAVDLAAVARDDQLLDLLAARAGAPAEDPVASLLAAFAEEVDDGLEELLAEREVVAPAEQPGVRPRRGLKVASAALVIGATLSVSGVAAAVTGDPLAPYKGLVTAIAGEDQLPEQAARVAALNRALRGTRVQIAHGDLDGARDRLDALTSRLASMTDLSRGERMALQARIDALEAALARAEAKAAGTDGPAGKPTSAPGQGKPADAGKPENSGTSGRGADQDGEANARSGQQGGTEKAKPSKRPHPMSGERVDDQGSGSTADESVALDDQSADDQSAGDQSTDDPSDPSTGQDGSSAGGDAGQNGD